MPKQDHFFCVRKCQDVNFRKFIHMEKVQEQQHSNHQLPADDSNNYWNIAYK